MIIKYSRLSKENLIYKVKNICKLEKIEYTNDAIDELLFLFDYDIRQIINNLECIYYSYKILNIENINKLIDKPKPYYIEKILVNCINGNLHESINTINELYYKGYTPNDILLTFMKCLIEKKINNLTEEISLKIYEIISLSYIKVNAGNDTLLQLIGCVSKIYLYLHPL
jgi:replication factor C subunit 2/4